MNWKSSVFHVGLGNYPQFVSKENLFWNYATYNPSFKEETKFE